MSRDSISPRDLQAVVHEVPDFPQPGILFRDISPLLRHHFAATLAAMEGLFSAEEWRRVDAIVGVDARGFILAAGLAAKRGLGFVPVRKAGKLPPPVTGLAYSLEYGSAQLEMHEGKGCLLLIDDVLATGGSLRAAGELCVQSGYTLCGAAVLADLGIARDVVVQGHPVRSVFSYN